MRERTTWTRKATATMLVKMADDPGYLTPEHIQAQPGTEDYDIGGPSDFAEDVDTSNNWREDYEGGTTRRNEIGLPEMSAESLKQASFERVAAEAYARAPYAGKFATIMCGRKASSLEVERVAALVMPLDVSSLSSLVKVAEQAQTQQESDEDDGEEEQKSAAQQQAEEEDKEEDKEEQKCAGEQQAEEEDKEEEDDKGAQKQASLARKLAKAVAAGDFLGQQQLLQQMQQQVAQQQQQQVAQQQQQVAQQLQQAVAAGDIQAQQQLLQQMQQQLAQQQQVGQQQAPQVAQQTQIGQQQQQVAQQADYDALLADLDGSYDEETGISFGDSGFAEDGIIMDAPIMDYDNTPALTDEESYGLQQIYAADSEYQAALQFSGQARQASVIGTRPQGVSQLGGRVASSKDSTVANLSALWETSPSLEGHF